MNGHDELIRNLENIECFEGIYGWMRETVREARLALGARRSLDLARALIESGVVQLVPSLVAASREALIETLTSPQHAPMSDHDPRDGSCRSCPWPLHELGPDEIADALLAGPVQVAAVTAEPSDDKLRDIARNATGTGYYSGGVKALRAVWNESRRPYVGDTRKEP